MVPFDNNLRMIQYVLTFQTPTHTQLHKYNLNLTSAYQMSSVSAQNIILLLS